MCSDLVRALLLLSLAVCSCSVKEDRSVCPCWLQIDLSGLDQTMLVASGCTDVSWSVISMESDWCERGTFKAEAIPSSVEVLAPRDSLRVVTSGIGDFDPVFGVQAVPGKAFPRLFLWTGTLDASGDDCLIVPVLHKEHAVLHLYVKSVLQNGAAYSVTSGTSGCDGTGNPVQGEFRCPFLPDGKGYGTVVLPRQSDQSLKLNVFHGGELVRSVVIGEYIVESGYDWTAPDLGDIVIEVDFLLTGVKVSINQWQKSLSFTIVV